MLRYQSKWFAIFVGVEIKKPNIKLHLLLFFSMAIMFIGCNTTRYIPDDQYLLSNIDIKVDNRQVDKAGLMKHVRQRENLKILGFIKFHLWLYNISNKEKPNSWLRKIGEEPVIYDQGLKDQSVQQLKRYFFNKGYYKAQISDEVDLRNKRAFVTYHVETGEPYRIKNVLYTISDHNLAGLFKQIKPGSLFKEGDILDVDVLDKERSRVARHFQNNGYYRFVEDYIHYRIDSSLFSNEANVEMVIENARSAKNPEVEIMHKKYIVENYAFHTYGHDYSGSGDLLPVLKDTIEDNGFTFITKNPMPVRENVLLKTIEINPGEEYNKQLEERMFNNLYSLRQFKYVNIQFADIKGPDSTKGYLSGKVFLPMQVKQNYSVDIEGTNTSGNLGIAGNIKYQHRNLFRGAEIFDLSFRGATERQVRIIDERSIEFNMLELGGEAKLTVPGFWFPVDEHKFNLYSMPFTRFSMAYNYQERPDYTRSILNATFGYQWKSSQFINHNFNLLDLNAVWIFEFDSTFINSIKDLYIKSSYTNHIISSSNYSFIYNNQDFQKRPYYHYLRMNLEVAGNMLYLASTILGNEPVNDEQNEGYSYYELFSTRFAQYLKGDFDFRYGYRFDKYNSIATRAFFGIAFPYGNFPVMPFEKRYFTGGANGIRAWQVRTLGPGTYTAGADEYPNQSADIKIEANIEYRFKLFWLFEGALFCDAGNIWAINENDNREGAVFKFDGFYNEFAVGTGFGLRLVTNYFIIRTDLGVKLRDPSQPAGQRWIPGTRPYNSSDFNLNIAIGYPF
ncbi:MAG: BamA/TamA family outer membrane protein [Prolixibacteraceae bacterium]|nr:BamA/TamA family outer membrane protein [Prolixibacteraceae bacterium]